MLLIPDLRLDAALQVLIQVTVGALEKGSGLGGQQVLG